MKKTVTLNETEGQQQENSTPPAIKIIANHYNSLASEREVGDEGDKVIYDYEKCFGLMQQKGKELFGSHFRFYDQDKSLIQKLLCYFLKDGPMSAKLGINLDKGILLTGPIGTGKTCLMGVMRFLQMPESRFIIKSSRDISFEFIREGYEVIHRYSNQSFQLHTHQPRVYCFDDLGTENNLKYYGNECNIMAEVLLSRYDQFISRKLITHLTTNLSASEIEQFYGNRVRSRMREMFNLLSFNKNVTDKRK